MGYQVRCLDDLSTGKQENVDMLADEKVNFPPAPPLSEVRDDPRKRTNWRRTQTSLPCSVLLPPFIKGDIRDLDTCMKACEGVDYVLNQAAWGSVPRSIEMPLLYEEINIRGTLSGRIPSSNPPRRLKLKASNINNCRPQNPRGSIIL